MSRLRIGRGVVTNRRVIIIKNSFLTQMFIFLLVE